MQFKTITAFLLVALAASQTAAQQNSCGMTKAGEWRYSTVAIENHWGQPLQIEFANLTTTTAHFSPDYNPMTMLAKTVMNDGNVIERPILWDFEKATEVPMEFTVRLANSDPSQYLFRAKLNVYVVKDTFFYPTIEGFYRNENPEITMDSSGVTDNIQLNIKGPNGASFMFKWRACLSAY